MYNVISCRNATKSPSFKGEGCNSWRILTHCLYKKIEHFFHDGPNIHREITASRMWRHFLLFNKIKGFRKNARFYIMLSCEFYFCRYKKMLKSISDRLTLLESQKGHYRGTDDAPSMYTVLRRLDVLVYQKANESESNDISDKLRYIEGFNRTVKIRHNIISTTYEMEGDQLNVGVIFRNFAEHVTSLTGVPHTITTRTYSSTKSIRSEETEIFAIFASDISQNPTITDYIEGNNMTSGGFVM